MKVTHTPRAPREKTRPLETPGPKEASVKRQEKEEGWTVGAWAGKASRREWPRAAPGATKTQCFRGH